MQRTFWRRRNASAPVGWVFVWLGLGLLLAAWPVAALGQPPSPVPEPASASTSGGGDESFWFSDRFTGRGEQALGAVVRGGFISGPGIGREDGFVPLEFMPYSMFGDGLLFGDLRGFRTTQDHYGANVGLGYRHYVSGWDRIFGINAYFDYDNSSSVLFRQYGLGLETYGPGWDMRLNTYFPIQTESKQLGIEFIPDSVRFSENIILYDQSRFLGTPMRGLDHELGVPLPGRFFERHDVRLYGGWYHFQADGVDEAWGWKGRLQGNLLPNISVGLEVTNDRVFDTNVVFSVAASYGGYRQPHDQPRTQFNRMTTPVNRQYNIVVARTLVRDVGLVALKPDGTPYFVEHVASNNPYNRSNLALMRQLAPQYDPTAPLGTYENPYLTIADAQQNDGNPNGIREDIIFTWTNSVYSNTTVALEQNVRVLGEGDGVPHSIFLQPFGFVLLPRAVDNPNAGVPEERPLFLSSPGNGVTLASNAEFSGFQLGDPNDNTTGPTGHGVFGNGVNNVDVDYVDVNFASGNGVLLQGVGTVRFFQSRIFNANLNGLYVNGGQARVTFEGDGLFDPLDPASADIVFTASTPGLSAVLIENTQPGSFVDLFAASPSAIHYTGAGGILVRNSLGSAQFGDVFIAGNVVTPPLTGEAINIVNNGGAYTFSSPVEIQRSAGDAINIEDLAFGGVVTFSQPVQILDRGGHGVDLDSNAGNVNFITDLRTAGLSILTASPLNFVGAPAIEYQNSSGNATFSNIVIAGGLGPGIVIGDVNPNINNTGIFRVRGSTEIDAIAGLNITIVDDGDPTINSLVEFNGVDIDARGSTGINIVGNRMPVRFRGRTAVANSALSSNTAVIISGNTEEVRFENLVVTGAYNSPPVPTANTVAGVSVTDNPSNVQFDLLSITTLATGPNGPNEGVGLFGRRVGTVTFDAVSGQITNVAGGLFVNDGLIDAINESAIDVMASVIGMSFTSVSALDAIGPGIVLANNISAGRTPDFGVFGSTNVLAASGGTIDSSVPATFNLESLTAPPTPVTSGAGVFLLDTGVVVLNQMLIQNNDLGIDAQTVALAMDNDQVLDNTTFGLRAIDVLSLTVVNSTFTGNGPGTTAFNNNEILALATVQDTYNWRFQTNTITDFENSAVLLGTVGSGTGSTLNLQFVDNDVTLGPATLLNAANLAIGDPVGGATAGWNGPLNAVISTNDLIMQDAVQTGIFIRTPNNLAQADVNISNNIIRGVADGDIGILVNASGPSTYLIENNQMTFIAPSVLATRDIRAMQFDFAANSNTIIRNNIIDITAEFGDGIIFNTINAPASVRIEGNDITITDLNGTLGNEFGIAFLLPVGTINFFGDTDNIVTINTSPFFITNGFGPPWFLFNGTQFNGSILVNGVPQP